MFKDITVQEWLELKDKGELAVIDVRSPSEFEDATIPGSLNIPLFNDEERAEIGTLYKQVSAQAAQERGLEIVSAKLPGFIRAFRDIGAERKMVFCWRGGMRSKTTATVLSLMNIRVFRLTGGVRAYRNWVLESLSDYHIHPQAIVLHGNTGTGKSQILRRLREQGQPVLDLEALAGHRGSIFGHIGLKAHNQKTFESHLLQELMQHEQAPYLFMEAESKRIGKCVLPDFVTEAKKRGVPLLVDMPVEARVAHILADYRPEQHKEQCMEAFHHIKKRLHTPIAAEIQSCLETDRFDEAVELLLLHYYDPRYAHTAQQYEQTPVKIRAGSVEDAADRILDWLDARS